MAVSYRSLKLRSLGFARDLLEVEEESGSRRREAPVLLVEVPNYHESVGSKSYDRYLHVVLRW